MKAFAIVLLAVVVLIPIGFRLLDLRPGSFSSTYRREVEKRPRRVPEASVVSESDLMVLPPLVQRYLRRAGVVGRPRVQNVHMTFHGQMRNGRDGPWMDVRGEQFDSFEDRARVFLLRDLTGAVPFEALHVYAEGTATMRVRAARLFDVVDARGPLMNQSETVTFFNDMCLLAPGSLLHARIAWQEMDARTARATFDNHGISVSADLIFDEAGDLVGFLSNDRYQSADGKTFRKLPWWTPVGGYRQFGATRIAAAGEATWKEPAGDFTYARFVIDDVRYNVGTTRPVDPESDLARRGTAAAAR